MPLGISFHISDSVPSDRCLQGEVKAQKNFLKYLLYISFFPSVVQGPIPRYADLGTQLYEEHRFEYDNLRDGALLIPLGICKEADPCRTSRYVCRSDLWKLYAVHRYALFFVATAAFSIQIYADFGMYGYCDRNGKTVWHPSGTELFASVFFKDDAGVLETLACDAWKLV